MRRCKKKYFLLIFAVMLFISTLFLQSSAAVYVTEPKNEFNPPQSDVNLADTFHVVSGGAYIRAGNQVVITENVVEQKGGLWYKYPIDLTEDFDLETFVYLGNKDKWGGRIRRDCLYHA